MASSENYSNFNTKKGQIQVVLQQMEEVFSGKPPKLRLRLPHFGVTGVVKILGDSENDGPLLVLKWKPKGNWGDDAGLIPL